MPDTPMTFSEFTYTWTACAGVLGAAGLAFLVVAALYVRFRQNLKGK